MLKSLLSLLIRDSRSSKFAALIDKNHNSVDILNNDMGQEAN